MTLSTIREFCFVVLFMKNLTWYTLSLSGGKDSLALFLRLLDEEVKLDEVVMVDLGDEYQAVYDVMLYVASICMHEKIKLTILEIPKTEEYLSLIEKTKTDINMFQYMVFHHKKKNGTCGYGWCGKQRWGTAMKRAILNNYYQSLKYFIVEYVGIAFDETERMDIKPHKNYAKIYPLVKWKMTEKDCLKYCYDHGVYWMQSGIRLYDILDRVSCVHCQNKNLKELRNIRKFLVDVWEDFKIWQEHILWAYRSTGETIQDLDKRFESEDEQMDIFSFLNM